MNNKYRNSFEKIKKDDDFDERTIAMLVEKAENGESEPVKFFMRKSFVIPAASAACMGLIVAMTAFFGSVSLAPAKKPPVIQNTEDLTCEISAEHPGQMSTSEDIFGNENILSSENYVKPGPPDKDGNILSNDVFPSGETSDHDKSYSIKNELKINYKNSKNVFCLSSAVLPEKENVNSFDGDYSGFDIVEGELTVSGSIGYTAGTTEKISQFVFCKISVDDVLKGETALKGREIYAMFENYSALTSFMKNSTHGIFLIKKTDKIVSTEKYTVDYSDIMKYKIDGSCFGAAVSDGKLIITDHLRNQLGKPDSIDDIRDFFRKAGPENSSAVTE